MSKKSILWVALCLMPAMAAVAFAQQRAAIPQKPYNPQPLVHVKAAKKLERGTEDYPAFAEWLLSAAQRRRQPLRALSIRQHTKCFSSTYFPFPFSLVTS